MEGGFYFGFVYLFPFGTAWKTASKSYGDFTVKLDFHSRPGEPDSK